MPPLLELKNVSVIKGGARILRNVSFEIHPGEHAAILGPNGAGKSTLLKLITREYYPLADESTVFRIWGKESWNIFELRHLIGLVSNDLQAAYTRSVTGLDTVLSGFYGSIGLHKEKITAVQMKKALKVIDFLGIEGLKSRTMSTMSSGEARRFLIGRALVHDPKALVLDEPFTSLDLAAARQFRETIRKIARSGISIILVTHDPLDIIPEIRRVVLMKDGGFILDEAKEAALTDQNISRLFGMPVRVTKLEGDFYFFS